MDLNKTECSNRTNCTCNVLNCSCSNQDVIKNNPENYKILYGNRPVLLCGLYIPKT